MAWLRVPVVAWRLVWPYVLAPWRSPLLRWRMETYGGLDAHGRPLDAHRIHAGEFFRFLCRNRSALTRFLYWAALL